MKKKRIAQDYIIIFICRSDCTLIVIRTSSHQGVVRVLRHSAKSGGFYHSYTLSSVIRCTYFHTVYTLRTYKYYDTLQMTSQVWGNFPNGASCARHKIVAFAIWRRNCRCCRYYWHHPFLTYLLKIRPSCWFLIFVPTPLEFLFYLKLRWFSSFHYLFNKIRQIWTNRIEPTVTFKYTDK